MPFQLKKSYATLGTGFIAVCASAFAADQFRQAMPLPSSSPSVAPSSVPSAQPSQQPAANLRRLYRARLRAVNPYYSNPRGISEFVVDGGNLGVVVHAQGLDPNIIHEIYLSNAPAGGPQCPNASADTNSDGIIDQTELQAVLGAPAVGLSLSGLIGLASAPVASPTLAPTMIPTMSPTTAPTTSPTLLPSATPQPSSSGVVISPEAQTSGGAANGNYPLASSSGNLTYIGSAPISGLLTNLSGNMVITIDGVDPNDTFPSSATSPNGETVNQSLPVACGGLFPVQE